MPYADKKVAIKRQNQWIAQHYDKINLTVPKGKKKAIQEYAKLHNTSVNKLIWDLICKKLNANESDGEYVEEQIDFENIIKCLAEELDLN